MKMEYFCRVSKQIRQPTYQTVNEFVCVRRMPFHDRMNKTGLALKMTDCGNGKKGENDNISHTKYIQYYT